MNKRFVLTLLLVATAGAFSNVLAQTVWRCGADGRSYSDSPCPDGRPVAVADARSAAEVAQGLAVLARDQRLARCAPERFDLGFLDPPFDTTCWRRRWRARRNWWRPAASSTSSRARRRASCPRALRPGAAAAPVPCTMCSGAGATLRRTTATGR